MNILIVESKAKCKTLLKYLGKDDWRVLPTGGHVERLPEDRSLHPPKEVKKAYWAHQPDELPQPPWFWTERGEAAIRVIEAEAAKHESVTFYLATDPDREGERIAWHLERLLSRIAPCHRVEFHEITKLAVLAAVNRPHQVDQRLVDAALIRTFIDRVVGWRSLRIAKKFTTTSKNSMGRVQTPTLGFVVERELEREAHVPVRYFEVSAATAVTGWRVRFHEKKDDAAWVDDKKRFVAHRTSDESLATKAHAALLEAGSVTIQDVTRKEKSQSPGPPLSTDALIQAAGSRWGWSPKKTGVLASHLYEAGHLTYIRTDSTRLAPEAVEAGRSVIADTWGADQVGATPTSSTGAGAQDAHEAIRPTDMTLESAADADPDAQKLYALVRSQALASLMVSSRRVTLSLRATCDGLEKRLDGSVGWYAEPGWRRAFQAAGLGDGIETTPIHVEVGTAVALSPDDPDHPNPELREGQTEPPPRYKEHTLVKAMKEGGIGRPSTYAKTVQRLEDRGYVTLEQRSLVPTKSGRNIWLEAAPLFCLPDRREAFQAEYTAEMEALLDDVAEGRREASGVWDDMLEGFKAAHAAALAASKTGPVLPRTRRKIEDYMLAEPPLAGEIGDPGALTEQQGRDLLAELKTRGIELLPSDKQNQFLEKLIDETDLTLDEAIQSADLDASEKTLNRNQAGVVIDYLLQLAAENQAPSKKQMRFIEGLAKELNLGEAEACGFVEMKSFDELTGGKDGTASTVIEELVRRKRAKRPDKPGAKNESIRPSHEGSV